MSLLKCTFAHGRKTKSRKKRGNSFFHLFSRSKSDAIRVKVSELYGYPCEGTTPYDDFLSLGEPVYNKEEFGSLINLVATRALYSKDADIVSPLNQEETAFNSFLLSERSCEVVNRRLREMNLGETFADADAILFIAQRKISSILGVCPTIDDLKLTFGPGASTSCTKITNARRKLSTIPSITISSLHILSELRDALPMYAPKAGDVMDAKIDFVPKNLKTHRMICIEPTVSGMVQRGIGSVIKKKLLKAGVDLRDQSINRRRSAEGSLISDLCTIDLERASDSVATHLVLDLLPFDWFELLDSVRSKQVRYKDKTFLLEKFSSMGNGYTFELESLIFYSLAYAIARHYALPFDFTVYGDDMVANLALAEKIVEIFPYFGFTPNKEKSFLSGPFRESCGFDAFLGIDIRPFFVRDRMSVSSLVQWWNFLERKPIFDPNHKIRDYLFSLIPSYFRKFGPDGFGDGHLISRDFASFAVPYKRKYGWCGYTFLTCTKMPHYDLTDNYSSDWKLPAYVSSTYREGDQEEEIDYKWSPRPESDVTVRRSLKTDCPSGIFTRVYVLGE